MSTRFLRGRDRNTKSSRKLNQAFAFCGLVATAASVVLTQPVLAEQTDLEQGPLAHIEPDIKAHQLVSSQTVDDVAAQPQTVETFIGSIQLAGDRSGFRVCHISGPECAETDKDGAFTIQLPEASAILIYDQQSPPRTSPLVGYTTELLTLNRPIRLEARTDLEGQVTVGDLPASEVLVCPVLNNVVGISRVGAAIDELVSLHGDYVCSLTTDDGTYSNRAQSAFLVLPSGASTYRQGNLDLGPERSRVAATLFDANGRPLRGVEACLWVGPDHRPTTRCTLTNQTGQFDIAVAGAETAFSKFVDIVFRDPQDEVAAEYVRFTVKCEPTAGTDCTGLPFRQDFRWSDRPSQAFDGSVVLEEGVLVTATVQSSGHPRDDALVQTSGVDFPRVSPDNSFPGSIVTFRSLGLGRYRARVPTAVKSIFATATDANPGPGAWGTIDAGSGGEQAVTLDLECEGRADVNCDGVVRIAIIGDSYISGEGTNDYFTPISGPATACHRSSQSWAYQVGLDLISTGNKPLLLDDGGDRVEMLACSGATSRTVLHGQHGEQGQVDRLGDMNEIREVDIILISVGGNDAGFSDVITNCLYSIDCRDSYSKRVQRAEDGASSTFSLVRRLAPQAVVVAATYPVGLAGQTDTCGAVKRRHWITGWLRKFEIESWEREWLSELVAPAMNTAIAQSAARHNVRVVDYSTAFEGNEVCSTSPYAWGIAPIGLDGASPVASWIVELASQLGEEVGQESFHPNKNGHDHLARTFWEQMPDGELTNWSDLVLPLSTADLPLAPPERVTFQVGNRTRDFGWGDRFELTGSLAPGDNGLVFLQSTPLLLGEIAADSNGKVSSTFEIPAGLYSGPHVVSIIDPADGHLIHLDTVSVSAPTECDTRRTNESDFDGDHLADRCDGDLNDGPAGDMDADGVPNSTDSCPTVYNPSQANLVGELADACSASLGFNIADVAVDRIGDVIPRADSAEPSARCGAFTATIVGTDGNDVLTGTDGPDVVAAGAGNDQVDGLGGNDIICGGPGDDLIRAGPGFDKVFAGSGKDDVEGGPGNDLLVGGLGADEIFGGNGNDRIQGGGGNDELLGGNGQDRISGGSGHDVLRGGKSADKLFGNLGRDQLFGELGNDVLRGGAWSDIMNGGPGANDGCTLNDPAGIIETRVGCEGGVYRR